MNRNFVFTALIGLHLAACGDSGPARTSFDVSVAGSAATSLANDYGYTVALSEATVSLGPVHFFSGEPLFTRTEESWPWRVVRAVLGIGVAHAHPGHYQEGDALAEVLDTRRCDLLAGSTALGRATGVTGLYRSAQIALGGDGTAPAVAIRGKATGGGGSVEFVAALDISEKVTGIAVGEQQVDSKVSGVRIDVDLKQWIERVDFSQLSGDQPVTIESGSQAYNALYRGVNNTSAFSFRWTVEQE